MTDSLADVFWTIPVDNRGRPTGAAEAVPLTGDFREWPRLVNRHAESA